MLGAIAGDVIGSVFEVMPIKSTDFKLFRALSTYTDDTVLTVAVADAILNGTDYGKSIKSYARRHPMRGYGPRFLMWMASPSTKPYNSWGNGSAMRVSPVGFAFDDEDKVLEEAKRSAECTHNHPEGIKGAQATALAILMGRTGKTKEQIKARIEEQFGYDLSRTLDEIRPTYKTDLSCRGSVPESIIAFLESDDFEGAIRNAVSLGGDTDTMAAIAGGIAQAFYGEIPREIVEQTRKRLPKNFLKIVDEFSGRYG